MANEIVKLKVEMLDPELVGRGYSRPNLNNMRKFYLMYPICQTSDKSGLPNLQTNGICQTSDKLTWSHICELITIDDQI